VVVTGTDRQRSRRGGREDAGIAGEWVLDPCLEATFANGRTSIGKPVRPAMPLKRSSRMTDRLKNRRQRGSADDGAPPTATFNTDKGNIDIRLAVVNQMMTAKGNGVDGNMNSTEPRREPEAMFIDQVEVAPGNTGNAARRHEGMARIQVETIRGHIRVELVRPGTI